MNNVQDTLSVAPLGNYGGATQTMPLLPGSLGLGTGATFDDASGNPILTDQRGLLLPTAAAPDIGAVQSFAAPTTVAAAVVSPSEIDLSWSDTNSAATEYDISEYIGSSWVPYDSVDASQSGYQVTGLSPGASYSFGLTSNDNGFTNVRVTVTATPPVQIRLSRSNCSDRTAQFNLKTTGPSAARGVHHIRCGQQLVDAGAHLLKVLGAGQDCDGFFQLIEFILADDYAAVVAVRAGDFDAPAAGADLFVQLPD